MNKELKAIVKSYLGTMLWSSSDGDLEHLDEKYDLEDISLKTVKQAIKDCKDFRLKADRYVYAEKMSLEQIGHDFWLTRNGHGAGFWDRDLGKLGDDLTKICEQFNERYAYVGGDNKIYTV